MKITKHAGTRMQQRGFSEFSMSVIYMFGREESAPGGAARIIFGKREHQQAVGEFKRMIQMLDKAKDGKIIFCNNSIITVYK